MAVPMRFDENIKVLIRVWINFFAWAELIPKEQVRVDVIANNDSKQIIQHCRARPYRACSFKFVKNYEIECSFMESLSPAEMKRVGRDRLTGAYERNSSSLLAIE